MVAAIVLAAGALGAALAAVWYFQPFRARTKRIRERTESWQRTTGRIVDFVPKGPGNHRLDPVAHPVVELSDPLGRVRHVTPLDPPLINAFVTDSTWPILVNPANAAETSFAEQHTVWWGLRAQWVYFVVSAFVLAGAVIAYLVAAELRVVALSLDLFTESAIVFMMVLITCALGCIFVVIIEQISRAKGAIPAGQLAWRRATSVGSMRCRRAHPAGFRSRPYWVYWVVTFVLPDGRRVVGQPINRWTITGYGDGRPFVVRVNRQDPTHFALDLDAAFTDANTPKRRPAAPPVGTGR